MKLKIKVKRLSDKVSLPKIIDKGDWIDLQCAEETTFNGPRTKDLHRCNKGTDREYRDRDVVFDFKLIPLGIAMELPEGFEAVVVPRSSTFKKKGLLLANSQGIIDNSYNGDDDQWLFPAIALRDTAIPAGGDEGRICQFRIQLSQKATLWQKLKWLLASGVEIEEVDHLGNEARGCTNTNLNTEDDAEGTDK